MPRRGYLFVEMDAQKNCAVGATLSKVIKGSTYGAFNYLKYCGLQIGSPSGAL
jgi:hypothetical protein